MIHTVTERIFSALSSAIPHNTTSGQTEALRRISNFIVKSGSGDTYLLKGYAGTGKTTIIGALVATLPSFGIKTVLMAPTGRAAKVMALYSKKTAFTIHRKIYRMRKSANISEAYALVPNLHTDTIFIVDEASMITDEGSVNESLFGSRNLLQDLVDYVKSGKNCRLILSGDLAQLPPVGQEKSPALDINLLVKHYGLRAGHFELTEVVRQEKDSGILLNATALRNEIKSSAVKPHFIEGFKDFTRLTGAELGEKLADDYGTLGPEQVVVICRSNKSANNYNRQIRYSGLWFDEEISAGDYIMCVKNNYFWLGEDSPVGFIANGDVLKIKRVSGTEERYGFRFADLTVEMTDYPGQPAFEIKVILDSLYTEAPALTREQSNNIYKTIIEAHPEAETKTARQLLLASDPHFNAIQIKFAYAVTCHKAQGGQWKNIFVDQGYVTDEMLNTGYLRWLYTAITRAQEKVYMVNFADFMFEQ
jgi:exodeoxyribonuclease V